MMNKWLLAIAVLMLTACSQPFLLSNGDDAEARLQQLLDQQRYARALAVIDGADSQRPYYAAWQARRPEVMKLAQQFDRSTVAKAKQLQQQNAWHDAKLLLEQAIDLLPENSESQQAYSQLLIDRNRYMQKQTLQLNLSLAERLLQEGVYREAIYAANPDSWASSWALRKYRGQREEVGEYLAEQGLEALQDKRFDDAKKLLTLSQELLPDQNLATTLSELNKKLDENWLRYLAQQQQQKQKAYQQVVADYQAAWQQKDYLKARSTLENLQTLNPDDPDNAQRVSDLKTAIAQQVEQDIANGELRYTEGDVVAALIIWTQARQLLPDHVGLNERIARAEQFLETYQELSN